VLVNTSQFLDQRGQARYQRRRSGAEGCEEVKSDDGRELTGKIM